MVEYVTLHNLLTAQRPASLPLALGHGEQRSWGDWRARVDQWRQTLAGQSGRTWGLYHEDAFEFSALLFALWASDKVACIPGSNQPVVVESLAERVDGLLGELPAIPGLVHFAEPQAETAKLPPVTLDKMTLDEQQLALEVFTSGSTGEPTAIPKYLFQLGNEVYNLHQAWDRQLGDALVVATVSHHHIYGLLFRVLWPLASGRCMVTHSCEYLEDILPLVADWPGYALISSPTHLSRIPPHFPGPEVAERCRAIFSSGAPLAKAASDSARAAFGQAPLEVYGSSETGGIAWRHQGPGSRPWQPFAGIEVAVEDNSDQLKIRSPYLPDPGVWFLTNDRVELIPPAGFELQGRVDTIVKVEGKRVSLTEMEARLLAHPWVEEVKLVVLTNKRSELGAVVVLNKAGREQLHRLGRRQLNLDLKAHMLAQYERPVVPRRWRYPETLPRNNEGKITQQALLALFAGEKSTGGEHAAEPGLQLPRVLQQNDEGDAWALTLEIPEDLQYFSGHFPVAPILPGVVQVHWAEYFGRLLLDYTGEFQHLEAVKFQHVIPPNHRVTLNLKLDRQKYKLYYRYSSATGQHSSGRIVKRRGV